MVDERLPLRWYVDTRHPGKASKLRTRASMRSAAVACAIVAGSAGCICWSAIAISVSHSSSVSVPPPPMPDTPPMVIEWCSSLRVLSAACTLVRSSSSCAPTQPRRTKNHHRLYRVSCFAVVLMRSVFREPSREHRLREI